MGQALTLLQVEEEIEWLCNVVRQHNVRSILEVGSKFGESLDRLVRAMPVGGRFVSVDLPQGTKAWPQSEKSLKFIAQELKRIGYEGTLILGDSTSADVIEQVRGYGPYDLVFIDANHTLPYVTKDWNNYGPMGRMVAFHDIAWRRAPEWVGVRIDVPQFWESIKDAYKHEEIKVCPTGKNNGIGVLWR